MALSPLAIAKRVGITATGMIPSSHAFEILLLWVLETPSWRNATPLDMAAPSCDVMSHSV